jgi:hypothetical protein
VDIAQIERIAAIAGAVLTLFVFSYLVADTFFYRAAVHIFIGAAGGFAFLAALEGVVVPWLGQTLLRQPFEVPLAIIGAIPFVVALLLLLKGTRRFSRLGDIGLVFVLGVGTGLALWGAIAGTLIPLTAATIRDFTPQNPANGLVVLVGTICVLAYFTYFSRRRPTGEISQLAPIRAMGVVGQIFIATTLGATYALLMISSLTVLTSIIGDRLLPLVGR